ncbi:MAG: hypothetical protein HYU28_11150 [Actinobacteria bacterium]|nr:hypothetical protein [Actinomycetota bacterium]
MGLITERGRERYRAYRRRRSDDRAWSPTRTSGRAAGRGPGGPVADLRRLRPLALPEPERRRLRRSRGRDPMSREALIGAAFAAVLALAALWWGWSTTRVHAAMKGIEDGVALQPEEAQDLSFRIEVSPSGRLDEAKFEFDEHDVLSKATIRGDVIQWKPGPLDEGEHHLRLTVPRPILPDATLDWTFTVDGTPPTILAPPNVPARGMRDPVKIDGNVEGAEQVLVNGQPLDLNGDGEFHLEYTRPPPGPIEIRAEDEAGNRRTALISVPIKYRPVRGVHVTAEAWDNPGLRQNILDLLGLGVINTVELDIKDEGGIVGHTTTVPLARTVGASPGYYDLKRQVDLLHEKGAWVVGRIVAFRDPKLADWAWANRQRDFVIQNTDGNRYGAYDGAFTSFGEAEVREYNIALAVEAVEAGVDDIMYDYVRRPEGDLSEMRIPGLEGTPEEGVVAFLEESHRELRRLGAFQGAAVFGVAATRPEQSGQNILDMAYHTDYIAPMLYPSHWNVGEYGISDPEMEPYEIVKRSLRDFRQGVFRTGRPLVPWIQHFSLDVVYTTEDVVAQVKAVADMGFTSWMMWDPVVTYDADALEQSTELVARR